MMSRVYAEAQCPECRQWYSGHTVDMDIPGDEMPEDSLWEKYGGDNGYPVCPHCAVALNTPQRRSEY